jgi:hypothetical protein
VISLELGRNLDGGDATDLWMMDVGFAYLNPVIWPPSMSLRHIGVWLIEGATSSYCCDDHTPIKSGLPTYAILRDAAG